MPSKDKPRNAGELGNDVTPDSSIKEKGGGTPPTGSMTNNLTIKDCVSCKSHGECEDERFRHEMGYRMICDNYEG